MIEERLTGPELSVFAFVDGETVSTPVAARDYKRAYDGNVGANTGGMGAYTSPGLCPPSDLERINATILKPIAEALVAEGCPYQGILYAGLMLTENGPQVIEFNCRFGDPECEPLMLRLDTDLAEICSAVAEGRLRETPVVWNNYCAVGVVIVSSNYPATYETGYPIEGELPEDDDQIVFHAGTANDQDGGLVTAGEESWSRLRLHQSRPQKLASPHTLWHPGYGLQIPGIGQTSHPARSETPSALVSTPLGL